MNQGNTQHEEVILGVFSCLVPETARHGFDWLN
jgi:hypothetical protein